MYKRQCICFGSAEDFLDEAGSDRFDLLLLDLMLPGMDGLACLKQLQLQAASQPALRVVIVTALNDADKKEEALANGAEAYVLKPDLFDGNRRATAPKQLALLGRDHPLANQTIERLIKTLRSRGWNQHPCLLYTSPSPRD